jgi:hypothetical protein
MDGHPTGNSAGGGTHSGSVFDVQSRNLSLFSRTLFTFLAIRMPRLCFTSASMISAFECRQHDPSLHTQTPDLAWYGRLR